MPATTFRLSAPIPSESDEGIAFIRWCRWAEKQYPELELLYHIPNGGARDIQTGARLKREGVLAGMLDYCLPVPRGGFGALYLELKIITGGVLSEKQKKIIVLLERHGNKVVVCAGWEAAKNAVIEYLNQKKS